MFIDFFDFDLSRAFPLNLQFLIWMKVSLTLPDGLEASWLSDIVVLL